MNITCIHCNEPFSVTAEQLGLRCKCPHCKATVILPKTDRQYGQQQLVLEPPSRWLENSLCSLGAVILHLLVLIVLALIPWGDFTAGKGGEGDQIMIGQLPREQLVNDPVDELDATDSDNPSDSDATDFMQDDLLSPSSDNPLSESEMDLTLGAPSGGSSQALEIQSLHDSSVLAGGSEDFGQMVMRLKRDGLDIVICFDSTGSMQGEIDQVKDKIQRIGNTLIRLIPKTRISICTYRDTKDHYLVKGWPLTDNLVEVVGFLETIDAAGGGDRPEAVHEGLAWSIDKNQFRRRSRKIVLLFGDAPPHQDKKVRCQKMASDFRKNFGGVVSTVTCRSEDRLEEFVDIARLGGGESYLTRNEREIMTQLIVLVFGSEHRKKVIEAFDLMNER